MYFIGKILFSTGNGITKHKLTEKQEAALAWLLNDVLTERIAADKKHGYSWAGANPEKYKNDFRDLFLSGEDVKDRLADIEKRHEDFLKTQFGIGSRPGRSVTEG